MQTFVAYDGKSYPVRDGFLIFPDGWSRFEEDRVLEKWRGQFAAAEVLRAARPVALTVEEFLRLMNVATEAWTERQREVLTAWKNRDNIDNALKYLNGADWREFGFETVCQIHGNQHTRSYTCGCSFHVLFDHHLEHPQDEDIKPLRAEHICDKHRQVSNSLEGQFWASARDSATAA